MVHFRYFFRCIYLDSPDDCRQYTSLITEVIRYECEVIKVIDLYLNKAQSKLSSTYMQNSRPARFIKGQF